MLLCLFVTVVLHGTGAWLTTRLLFSEDVCTHTRIRISRPRIGSLFTPSKAPPFFFFLACVCVMMGRMCKGLTWYVFPAETFFSLFPTSHDDEQTAAISSSSKSPRVVERGTLSSYHQEQHRCHDDDAVDANLGLEPKHGRPLIDIAKSRHTHVPRWFFRPLKETKISGDLLTAAAAAHQRHDSRCIALLPPNTHSFTQSVGLPSPSSAPRSKRRNRFHRVRSFLSLLRNSSLSKLCLWQG